MTKKKEKDSYFKTFSNRMGANVMSYGEGQHLVEVYTIQPHSDDDFVKHSQIVFPLSDIDNLINLLRGLKKNPFDSAKRALDLRLEQLMKEE